MNSTSEHSTTSLATRTSSSPSSLPTVSRSRPSPSKMVCSHSPLPPSSDADASYLAGPGLKSVVDVIDVREDFKAFMQHFTLSWQMSGQRGPRREGPADEGFVRSLPLPAPFETKLNDSSPPLPL